VWRASDLADSYLVAHTAGSASSSSTARNAASASSIARSAAACALRRFFEGPAGLSFARRLEPFLVDEDVVPVGACADRRWMSSAS
jgi:hypothetical protein